MGSVCKQGPYKEFFISNQCLEVIYEIDNNYLEKELSIKVKT